MIGLRLVVLVTKPVGRGHGITNSSDQGHMNESDERALIVEATAAIDEGTRPVGWTSPWVSNSAVTMDLLQEAGIPLRD